MDEVVTRANLTRPHIHRILDGAVFRGIMATTRTQLIE